jgi:disulfide bond formation protein DsbB
MQALALQLRPRWPIVALLASAALLAGAHAFETFGHMAPCPMCLAQRQWHWGIVAIAILALIAARVRPDARWAAFVLGLAFVGSFAMAGWHVAVEQHWVQATCEAGGNLDNINVIDFSRSYQVPHCDLPAWKMFGISMAGYNALISLALALASFVVATAPEQKP